MKILLCSSNYWPEPTGIALYVTDLAETLQSKGHKVSVLTSLPHYPWWKVPKEFAYLGEGIAHRNEVKLIRVKHFIPRKMNAFIRMRFEFSMWWNLRRESKSLIEKDFDLVMACIPTVAAGIVGKAIAHDLKIPFGLVVQDLSGAGAKQSGLQGGAIISKIARAVEKQTLSAANGLVLVSPAMKNDVLASGVEACRIQLILNYSAREITRENSRDARLKFGWAIEDFIVMHTGNMGAKQDLENVVRAADTLTGVNRIKILLVGHGNQETTLKQLCDGRNNISVLPAVEDSDYSALLSAADLLLINERSTQMEMSLPSKLTSYLFSERPVVAAVSKHGATWQFLQGIAELVDAGKPELLARAIEELSRNAEKRNELASKGLQFAKTHLDPVIGRKKYLDWVENLIESKHG